MRAQRQARESYQRLRELIKNMTALDQFVWLSTLLLLMPIEEDYTRSSLLATDGRTIFYNPDLVAQQGNPDVLRTELGGLAFGCALKHHTRRGDRDPWKWQWASWQTRLPMMRDAGLPVESGGLELSAEQAYERAPDPPDTEVVSGEDWQDRAGPGEGEGEDQSDAQQPDDNGEDEPPESTSCNGHGEIMDSPATRQQDEIGDADDAQEDRQDDTEGGAGSDDDAQDVSIPQPESPASPSPPSDPVQEEEQRWDEALQHARQASKLRGTVPRQVQEMIEGMHRSELDPYELLRRFMTAQAQTDYSWSRPNRRFIDDDIYLPSLTGETMGPMLFVVDTSDSMSNEELLACWNVVRSCAEDLQPESVTVVECSAEIGKVRTWHPSDLPARLEITVRGGTNFIPAFEWVEQNMVTAPSCLICLTDTMGEWPDYPPPYPVMCLATSRLALNSWYRPPFWCETIDLIAK